MAEGFVLALDQGTTSTRAMLFDASSRILASATAPVPQHYPQPGWVEHSPKDLWLTTLDCLKRCVAEAKVDPARIAALGLTNQRETTVVWDAHTGKPIHHALVWQDRRTAGRVAGLKREGFERHVRRATGLVLDAYFSASKVEWLLDHVPGARKRAEGGHLLFGTVDTWLLWHLTAGLEDNRAALHATDPGNASRTMLYDGARGRWDPRLREEFRVPESMLPEVRDSSGDLGTLHPSILGHPVPIAGVAGDQQAALFGQACFGRGDAKNTYGTGCFVLANAGTAPPSAKRGLLHSVAWRLGGRTTYAYEGSVFVAGAAVEWLRDLGLVAQAKETQALAESVPDSGGVVFVPAFVGLGSPHWDSTARGALLGLTRGTTRAHLARAALDAIALQSHEALEAMARATRTRLRTLKVDGGVAANDYMLQVQADVSQARVVRPKVTETTALGAAYLAGLAQGVWPDVQAIAEQWTAERVFEPRMRPAERKRRLDEWKRAVARARGWIA